MESRSPALILASRRRALTGSSRGLSRAYDKGELVRVRTGVYYSKPAWLALKLGNDTRQPWPPWPPVILQSNSAT
jgi:hypothetical protein